MELKTSSICFILTAAVLLGGCHAGTTPAARTIYVASVPPPRASRAPEILPPRLRPEAVWVDGHYAWRADSWRWVNGAWVIPPCHGYRFIPPRALPRDGRFVYLPGRWASGSRGTSPGRVVYNPMLVAVQTIHLYSPPNISYRGDFDLDSVNDGGRDRRTTPRSTKADVRRQRPRQPGGRGPQQRRQRPQRAGRAGPMLPPPMGGLGQR